MLRSRRTLSSLSLTTSEVSASSTPPRRSSQRKDPPEAVADTTRASSARRTSSRIHQGTRDELPTVTSLSKKATCAPIDQRTQDALPTEPSPPKKVMRLPRVLEVYEPSSPSVAAAATTLIYTKAYGGSLDGDEGKEKSESDDKGSEEEADDNGSEDEVDILSLSDAHYSDGLAFSDEEVLTFDVDSEDEAMKAFPWDKSKRKNYSIGGPQAPDLDRYPKNAREEVWEEYKKKRKAFNDQQRKKRAKLARQVHEGSADINLSEYKGCNLDRIRVIEEVEANRLMVNHTFSSRDIMYLRVAEEANLRSIVIRVNRSDNQQFVATGIDFYVRAIFTDSVGWTVTTAVCRVAIFISHH